MFRIPGLLPENTMRDSPGSMEIVQAYVRVRPPQVGGEGGLLRTWRCFAGKNLHQRDCRR